MADTWVKATLAAERTYAQAAAKLLRNAPPDSTGEMDADGKPVLRHRRKTLAELGAELAAKRASWEPGR